MPDTTVESSFLNGFTLGVPLGSHFGVSCYPTIRDNSDQRYIVKIISVPPSQTQLDALLITGAYPTPAAAADYFRELAEDIGKEAEFLRKMSELEGFLSYEDWQISPMNQNRIGYEIRLLGTYKLTLDKYMRRHSVTHLEAVNLGIDICAALAACRRAGMMYIDLKPGNIFLSSKKEYKIGDLGFASLSSLKFSSMPGKYRSVYTAPELHDDLNVLNETADTYALGMILYQIFNFGKLPEAPVDFPAPQNADPGISRIIMKACDKDPKKRWKDPAEMGRALVAYMQSNTINNTLIMPPLAPKEKTGPLPFVPAQPAAQEDNVPVSAPDTETNPVTEAAIPEETSIAPADTPEEQENTLPGSISYPLPEQDLEISANRIEIPESNNALSETDEYAAEEAIQPTEQFASVPQISEPAPSPAEDFPEEFPDEPPLQDLDNELAEVNMLLSSGNTMPKLAAEKKPAEKAAPAKRKHKGKGILVGFLIVLLLLAMGAAGFLFWNSYYLQNVDGILIEGTMNEMVVTVQSDIDESLLTVVCVDSYGTATRQNVRNGQAVFHELNPASLYKVNLEISGLHRLTGQTSGIFTTESITNVVSFSAITGSEDGSVLLSFTVEGHEPDEWKVVYFAENEPMLSKTFTGHIVTVENLIVGKEYSFQLETGDESPLTGNAALDFTATGLVLAGELTIVSMEDGVMTVQWKQPAGESVAQWHVRCYGEGYDYSMDTDETTAAFSGLEENCAYTVEVTADGMTQPARTSITANPITLTGLSVEDAGDKLVVTWDHSGDTPEGGWLVMYSIDNNSVPNVLKCETASAEVTPRIPGAVYSFTIQAGENVSLFNSTVTFTCPDAGYFLGHAISNYSLSAQLLPTPDNAGWNAFNVSKESYSNVFAPGQSISMVIRVNAPFYLDDEPLDILYVIRDADGNAIPELTYGLEANWAHLWEAQDYHYCSLNTTKAPSVPGSYTLTVYFDGGEAISLPFTVS